ncbi:choice-of-anchor P family protein [Streptantibioticus silvisoli]|uniref:Choice-of-anchor P family protein n=1 Tax=Streptantibioticus silvisoli TaxID=2705255 RepID=A0ABT6VX27_9ACTN|nr:choice-of-anchor P family protein [Streptantibioticus silvisoli]MDI5962013.1 choice-of-anchor P family protein [Streptantibioticus silvisoli]
MSSRLRRGIGLAVLSSLVGTLCLAAPATAAPSPVANAFVVSADAIGGIVAVPPTPVSAYPPGGTTTLVGLNLGPFATAAVLTATTGGSTTTGDSNASATVANLGVNLGTIGSLALTGVNSTCNATPAGATGSGVIASGSVSVLGVPILNLPVSAAPNTVVGVPGIGTITLNEQTTAPDGTLSVNALHLVLLPALGAANVIVGHADCAGAAPMVPSLSINKSAVETSFTAGETIHYNYIVTNTGAQELSDIDVADSGPGDPTVTCPDAVLEPGAEETCTATYVATAADVTAGEITDTATVTATLPDDSTVTATSNEVTIPALGTPGSGSIRVVKHANRRTFSRVGQLIRYTFHVTNTGTSTLTNVDVTDSGPGNPTVTCPETTLAPGASEDCTAVYRVTRSDWVRGRITDRGTATATTPTDSTVTSTSRAVTIRADRGRPGHPGRPGHHHRHHRHHPRRHHPRRHHVIRHHVIRHHRRLHGGR